MTRREFIKYLSGLVGAFFLSSSYLKLLPKIKRSSIGIKFFDREDQGVNAVKEALDLMGTAGNMIKPGDKVIVKPNFVCGKNDEEWKGETTSNFIIEGAVKALKDLGARVVVAEGSAGDMETRGMAEKKGLLDICKRYGVPFHDLNYDPAVKVKVPHPLVLDEVYIAKSIVESDKLVSVPLMKTHFNAAITLGMKNWVGILSRNYYNHSRGGVRALHRGNFHSQTKINWETRYGKGTPQNQEWLKNMALGAGIADIVSACPISLTIIDGIYGREAQAPDSCGDLVDIKQRFGHYMVITGDNVLSTDIITAQFMNQPVDKIPQFQFAIKKKIGPYKIQDINIRGAKLKDINLHYKAPVIW